MTMMLATTAAGLSIACLVLAGLFAIQGASRRRGLGPRERRRRLELSASRMLAMIRRLLPRLVSRIGRRDLGELIARAGMDGRLTVRDVAAARLLCAAIGVALVVRLSAAVPLRSLPLAAAVVLLLMAELPIIWLRRRAQRRALAMRMALPDALELMRACLAAGLPLRRSLSLVGDHCAEPVATEFVHVAAETAFGVPQSTALDGLVARNPQSEVRALVSAIRQAEKHGSPLAPVIAAQAYDARLALNREIVERAAKAGPKIQLIVSTTIVPAALLGFAAVLIAAIARGDIAFV